MPYIGWATFAGTELWNAVRTKAYVDTFLPTLTMDDVLDCPGLAEVLEDDPYTDPTTDGAEWVDLGNPATQHFYGLYPLTVDGLDDSTRRVPITETVLDGGVIGRARAATREVRVTGLLIAKNHAALEAGKVWLRTVLKGNECFGCGGDTFCFLNTCPVADGTDVDTLYEQHGRQLRDAATIFGPRVIEEFAPTCGAAMVRVEFVLAARPHIYGQARLVAQMRTGQATVFGFAEAEALASVPSWNCIPPAEPPLMDVADPDCPPPPPPPRPPQILPTCVDTSPDYVYDHADAIKVPAGVVPLNSDAVPVLTIRTGVEAVRQARIRFFAAPLDQDLADVDHCGYCGEFIVSYIPPSSTMTIDGMVESALIALPGDRSASGLHLLYGTGGAPFQWPVLACGTAYWCVIDFDSGSPDLREFTLSIAVRE